MLLWDESISPSKQKSLILFIDSLKRVVERWMHPTDFPPRLPLVLGWCTGMQANCLINMLLQELRRALATARYIMSSSAVSCSSFCGPSQLSPDDLHDDSNSYCHNGPRHHALADLVATAQQLAASEALSVSGTGPPRRHLLIQASNSSVYKHCDAAEAWPSPLEPRKLHSQQHQQTPAPAECQNVLQAQQQTPSIEHQLTRNHSACRCLYRTTNAASKAAAAAPTVPESAAAELPITPAHTAAAMQSRARHVSSSTNGQSRVQQWLSSMELRLQVPEYPVLPVESPCPAPRASSLAHRGSMLAHRDSILAHRDSILADRDSNLAHRSSILVHSGGILAQGSILAQSAAAAGEAAASTVAAAVGSRKRPATSAVAGDAAATAAGNAAAAALLAEFNSTCKRCRISSSSSSSPPQQQQHNLIAAAAAAAVAESGVTRVSEDVGRSIEVLPPPMFVIMGKLSREAASL